MCDYCENEIKELKHRIKFLELLTDAQAEIISKSQETSRMLIDYLTDEKKKE